MKKNIISIAVLTALTIPAAHTVYADSISSAEATGPTVYGRVRLGIQRDKRADDSNNFGVENSSSRFGVKGTEVVNDQLKVKYQYEFGVSAAEDNANSNTLTRRLSWVGIEGEMGTVSLGRQISAYYQLTGTNFDYGQGFNEENYLFLDTTALADKISDTVQYTFSHNGFSFGADLIMDQDDSLGGESFSDNRDGDFDAVDGYTVATQYKNDTYMIAAGYIKSDAYTTLDSGVIDRESGEVWSVYTYYNFAKNQQVYFGFDDGSTDINSLGDNAIDGQAYHVGYTGRFDNVGFWGVYSHIDLDRNELSEDGSINQVGSDRDHFSFGTAYYVSARTRFFAEGTFVDQDNGFDTNRQYVGIRHDF